MTAWVNRSMLSLSHAWGLNAGLSAYGGPMVCGGYWRLPAYEQF